MQDVEASVNLKYVTTGNLSISKRKYNPRSGKIKLSFELTDPGMGSPDLGVLDVRIGMKEMVPPTTQKDVRRFLGFTNYYRKFIPRFADIARPLTNLTRKDVEFEWTPQCQQAFELMKEMLLKEPILKYPDPKLWIHIIYRRQ